MGEAMLLPGVAGVLTMLLMLCGVKYVVDPGEWTSSDCCCCWW